MRDRDAAEHDRALAGEGMDVEAHAGARDQPRREPLLGAGEVGGRWSAFRAPDRRRRRRRSCPAARTTVGLVGRRARLTTGRIGRRQASSRNACGVWTRTRPARSTGLAEPSPTRPACRRPARTGAAPSKNSSARPGGRSTAGGQKGRAASWTSTASPSIAASPARTESARSAPPIDQRADVEARQAQPRPAPPDPRRSRPGRPHRRVAEQRLDRPAQHRLAAEQPILLGHAAAEALALAGGDDEGGDSHVARRLGALALSAKGCFL